MDTSLALLQQVGMSSSIVATWLTYVEDGIYLVTAALLGATAVVLIVATARDLVRAGNAAPMMQRALKAPSIRCCSF